MTTAAGGWGLAKPYSHDSLDFSPIGWRLRKFEVEFSGLAADPHLAAAGQTAEQDFIGQQVADFTLDQPPQRAGAGRQLGYQPFHGPQRPLPLGRADFLCVVHVSATDDVDDSLVQHAGRLVHQHEDALAANLEPGQVLAVALPLELANLLARLVLLRLDGEQPLEVDVHGHGQHHKQHGDNYDTSGTPVKDQVDYGQGFLLGRDLTQLGVVHGILKQEHRFSVKCC